MSLPEFFLATNSANGFISEFGNNYDAEKGWLAYIIKGGAGTGKSSLMRSIAKRVSDKKINTFYCPCSSDPDSLDGVIFPDKKVIVLDGTLPHPVEPKYPAICEQIVNTGAFWDEEKLKGMEKEILNLYKLNSLAHKKASGYIKAAGQLLRTNFSYALSATDIEKASLYAADIADKHIKGMGKGQKEWVRFLSGVTPKGFIFFGDTINHLSDKQIIICDQYGAVSSIFMTVIRDIALYHNYEIITVKNPILPNEIIDHIIIPELKLAFCSERRALLINSDERRIHARRFTDVSALHKNKEKITFNRRIYKELLEGAVNSLKEAKLLHDIIEKHYIDIMDFSHFEDISSKIAEKIISR